MNSSILPFSLLAIFILAVGIFSQTLPTREYDIQDGGVEILHDTASAAPSVGVLPTQEEKTRVENVAAAKETQKTAGEPVITPKDIQAIEENEVVVNDAPEAPVVQEAIAPYPYPPLSFDEVNLRARAALINIFCTSRGSLQPITASGVLIDPRGVILTNAHVGQYFLLEKDVRTGLECSIRTGAPAYPHFKAELMYLPPAWINEHAQDIQNPHPTGTGEHDWALLHVTNAIGNSALPGVFPHVPFDTREGIAQTSGEVLLASYPAGFLGGITVQRGLHPVTTIAQVGEVFTFTQNVIDLFSLGGVISAQGGSSGGAAINQWGHLVGLITTSSNAETTSARDLRAITTSHINRSAQLLSGIPLTGILENDITALSGDFQENIAPGLTEQLVGALND